MALPATWRIFSVPSLPLTDPAVILTIVYSNRAGLLRSAWFLGVVDDGNELLGEEGYRFDETDDDYDPPLDSDFLHSLMLEEAQSSLRYHLTRTGRYPALPSRFELTPLEDERAFLRSIHYRTRHVLFRESLLQSSDIPQHFKDLIRSIQHEDRPRRKSDPS